jgi:hypothetical protein
MKYGLLTVGRHQDHLNRTGETLHVYLDGEDVTQQCIIANDVVGYVQRFVHTDDGHVKIAWHDGEPHPLKSYTRGDVVIQPGVAFYVR